MSYRMVICDDESEQLKVLAQIVALEGGVELPVARGKYDSINRAFIEAN